MLAADADPAQVGFSPDGAVAVVTQRGTNSIVAFAVDASGLLLEPREIPSSGPTPYGFAFAAGGTLVVTEAFGAQIGKAAASSYVLDGPSATPVSRRSATGAARSAGRSRAPTASTPSPPTSATARSRATRSTRTARSASRSGGRHRHRRAEGSARRGHLVRRALPVRRRRRRPAHLRLGGRHAADRSTIGSWDGLPATVAGLAAS